MAGEEKPAPAENERKEERRDAVFHGAPSTGKAPSTPQQQE